MALAIALLAGCSPAPAGDARWLTQPTADQHTSLFFPISTGKAHAIGAPAVHVSGTIDCNSCHGNADSFRDFDCLTCHVSTAMVARHSRVGGFFYDSPSCYGCHPDGVASGAIDHTGRFPIAPGDTHAIGAPAVHLGGTIQCTSCHPAISNRSRVDCTICHDPSDQSAKHGGLIGPETNNANPLWSGTGPVPTGETANCLLCHANGKLQRVATHAQSTALPAGFAVAKGNHFQSCEQCHVDRTVDPARLNPELDFAAAKCSNCHSQARDLIDAKHTAFSVNLTSPPATTATCLSCHPDGSTVAGFQHPSFPVASADVHALGAMNCSSCHTPATNAAGDYKTADCTTCHTEPAMSPLHVAVSDLRYTTAAATSALCLRCHAESTIPVSITAAHTPAAPAHAPFLVNNGSPHYRQDCLACHVISRADKPWAADFAQPRHCTGCHADPQTTANHLGTSWSGYPGSYSHADAACISCHPIGDMGPFDHAPDFPTTAADVHNSGVAACTDCHANSTAPADVATITCIGCHNNGSSAVDPGGVDSRHATPAISVNIAGYAFDNASCLKCHAATVATPSWKNPLVLPVTQHTLLCFNVSGGTTHSVARTNNGVPYCFKCHDAMNAAAKPWGIDWTRVNCAACHSARSYSACR
jgi:hypothetical protein